MAVSTGIPILFHDINIVSYLKEKFVDIYISRTSEDISERITNVRQEIIETLLTSSSSDNILTALNDAKRYLEEVIEGYKGAGYEPLIDTGLKLKSRLLVGTGNPYLKGLFDIGMCWDPYLNLPYIPATSIKGVLRFSAELLSLCIDVFGNKEEAGDIIILDSYPISCERKLIDVDIINPHYKEVEGKIKEIDVNPVPIPFLTVAAGVTFRFVIMRRKGLKGCNVSDMRRILEYALRVGFGAKTSLAYGRFVMGDST